MPFSPSVLPAIAVALVLLAGAAWDARTNRIPNKLVLAGLALAFLTATATAGLSGLGYAALAALAAFVVGFSGFAIGAIGGGDAKFLMVGAAFVGWHALLPFLLLSAAFGGLLAVGVIAYRRTGVEAVVMTGDLMKNAATLGRKGHRGRLGDEGRLTVPYGVAIAAAALLVHFTEIWSVIL